MPDPKTSDAEKLARIKRIAQAHNTPASNVGAHLLAVKILEIINNASDEQLSKGDDHVGVPPMVTGG